MQEEKKLQTTSPVFVSSSKFAYFQSPFEEIAPDEIVGFIVKIIDLPLFERMYPDCIINAKIPGKDTTIITVNASYKIFQLLKLNDTNDENILSVQSGGRLQPISNNNPSSMRR
jgi:hypothetical protein